MKPERMTATFKEALTFWTKLGFISFGGLGFFSPRPPLLQKFHFPIHYLVPIGAAAGMVWKLFI